MARYYGALNQAEEGAPTVSIFGQAMRRAVTVDVVNHTGRDDVRGFAPVGRRVSLWSAPNGTANARQFATQPWGFRNFFGAFVARPAANRTVANLSRGYAGILPLDQQPSLFKPKPWNDPTLGAP